MRMLLCVLASLALVVLAAGSRTAPAGALRHPLNADSCPSRGYPYNIHQFNEYVQSHALLQQDASQLASKSTSWYSQQIFNFAFGVGAFAAEYVDRVGRIDGARPHTFKLNCSKGKLASILSGDVRRSPIKIVWASRFAAETPLLLFRLHTYKDLVDNHFISESSRLAYAGIPKPLVLEEVKSKILGFMPSITHHVLDDTHWRTPFSWSHGTANSTTDFFDHETETHHHTIYKEVAKQYGDLSDEDIVIYGDMDELPDEDLLFHLKHCKVRQGLSLPINSNAPMFTYDYRYLFRADHTPGPSFPYSLKFPQMWPFGAIRRANGTLRLRTYGNTGSSPSEPGGYHLTYLLFAPALYMKLWGIAEAGPTRALSYPHFRHVPQFLRTHRNMTYVRSWRSHIPHPKCVLRQHPVYKEFILRLPWLMAQNLQAFAFAAPCLPAFYDLEPQGAQC